MSTSSRSSSITQSQFSNFPYQQDAVRVVAQVGILEGKYYTVMYGEIINCDMFIFGLQHNVEGQDNCHRRFSVDPQLTSFDILKNLIGRAFDMKG